MLARAKRGGSACFFNKNPVALSIYLVYKKKRAGGQWHSRDNLVVSGIWYLVSVVFYSSGIEWVVESVVELTGMPVLMAARWWIPPLSRGKALAIIDGAAYKPLMTYDAPVNPSQAPGTAASAMLIGSD